MVTLTASLDQVKILQDHVQNLSLLKDNTSISEALLKLEDELGSRFPEFLKENFVPDIARYFRNVVTQSKLVQKAPELRDRILMLPLSHAAVLMVATEQQLREILLSGGKWTIAMLKDKLSTKIILGRVVTDRDWEIAEQRLGIGPIEIPLFKAQAAAKAENGDVMTDHLCSVLDEAGYKTTKIVKRSRKAKAKSPVPEDLGRLMLDRDSLQIELDKCTEEGPGKQILRQELNQTMRRIAQETGIDQDFIIDQLQEENRKLREQLAMATSVEVVEESAIVPQKTAKNLVTGKLNGSFKKLTAELIKFLPTVISVQSAIEREERLKGFLLKFQQSYA